MAIPFKRVKTVYDFQDTIPFGEYLGKTISWVIEFDPAYLKWCTKQENLIYLNTKCIDALDDRITMTKYHKPTKKSKFLQEPNDWFDVWDQDIPF